MKKIVILGCNGHAKSVLDILEQNDEYEIIGFIAPNKDDGYQYRGYKIIATDEEAKRLYNDGVKYAAMGIGYLGTNRVRNKLYENMKNIGFAFPTIVDRTAVIATDVVLEEGVMVGKGAVINANSSIGKMSIINSAAVIEHDCSIGEFSHIAVGAVLCGGVDIAKETFVGANATLIQGVKIGKNVVIGAGSIVLADVKEEQTVKGVVK